MQKFSLFFFDRPRTTALLSLAIVFFGAVTYTTLLQREGFPTVNTPVAIGQGTYFANDPKKVDADVAKPLTDFLLDQDGVEDVSTQSFDNFLSAILNFEEGVDNTERAKELTEAIKDEDVLPNDASITFEPLKLGNTERGDDIALSFYADGNYVATKELIKKAEDAAEYLDGKNIELVKSVSVIDQFERARNPVTGQTAEVQSGFDRFGTREGDETTFRNAIVIGVTGEDNVDELKLDANVRKALDSLNDREEFDGYKTVVSASNLVSVTQQIDELQTVLIEGLIAILVVGSLLIALRASFITVLAMFAIIAITNAILYWLGYSLNTITLFGLILSLSLIVDDTIIMVEALESRRRASKDPREIVATATKKVSRAMVAATLTAALCFTPLLFVSGVLGSFIRAIPVTIISALLVSLVVALILIPLMARYLLLTKDQIKKAQKSKKLGPTTEQRIAELLAGPMLWAQHSKAKLVGVGMVAVLVGVGFIVAGGYLGTRVAFNIFPSAKDANILELDIRFPEGSSIDQAQAIADRINEITQRELGDEFVRSSYYGDANARSATMLIDITDYKERRVTSPELVEELKSDFEDFDGATVTASQVDAGPPASDFTARINATEDRKAATKLANDVANYLRDDAELIRPDGSEAEIESVQVANSNTYARADNKLYVAVRAKFVDTDTTTLVTLAQAAIEDEFDAEKVESYGLESDAISFDFGQENENQDSFAVLAYAFPIVLLVIYVLLAIEFRSLLQPLLIFIAIPFSLFGVTAGLYLTDNAFSFFALLGFFALVGLSIKNTILLTDFANQARRAGANPVDAAHQALAERFRPLVATSLTAIVSLIPLALSSPFWESLAVVLIFGLASSTFLVVVVFPYYYLGAEYLRIQFRRYITSPIRRAFQRGTITRRV